MVNSLGNSVVTHKTIAVAEVVVPHVELLKVFLSHVHTMVLLPENDGVS